MKEGTVRACGSSEWLGLLCIVNIYKNKTQQNHRLETWCPQKLSDIPVNILY